MCSKVNAFAADLKLTINDRLLSQSLQVFLKELVTLKSHTFTLTKIPFVESLLSGIIHIYVLYNSPMENFCCFSEGT